MTNYEAVLADLERRKVALAAEITRIDSAMEALRVISGIQQPEEPSGEDIAVANLLRGWITEKLRSEPSAPSLVFNVAVIRTQFPRIQPRLILGALARMAKRGELERVRRGVYRLRVSTIAPDDPEVQLSGAELLERGEF